MFRFGVWGGVQDSVNRNKNQDFHKVHLYVNVPICLCRRLQDPVNRNNHIVNRTQNPLKRVPICPKKNFLKSH